MKLDMFVPSQSCSPPPLRGYLAALTRSHLIGDHPSGLTKEQTTETMDPSPKKLAMTLFPPRKFRACRSCEATPPPPLSVTLPLQRTFMKENFI